MNKQEIYDLLREKGVGFEVSEHIPVYTIDDMLALDLPCPDRIAKNLFVRDDKKRNYYLITVREEKRVDLREFAEKYGTRKLSFASENDLADILGLSRGAVTPFGLLNDSLRRVAFFIDRGFEGGIIGIHPNDNTATVRLNTSDLLNVIKGYAADVRYIDI